MLLLKDMSKNDPHLKKQKLMTFRSENFLELLVPSQPVNFGLGEGGDKVCGLGTPYWGKGGEG